MGYNNLIYLLYFDLLNFQLYILCSIFINFILICIKGKCSILSGPTMGTTRSGPMKAQRKPLLRRPSAAAPWEAPPPPPPPPLPLPPTFSALPPGPVKFRRSATQLRCFCAGFWAFYADEAWDAMICCYVSDFLAVWWRILWWWSLLVGF